MSNVFCNRLNPYPVGTFEHWAKELIDKVPNGVLAMLSRPTYVRLMKALYHASYNIDEAGALTKAMEDEIFAWQCSAERQTLELYLQERRQNAHPSDDRFTI